MTDLDALAARFLEAFERRDGPAATAALAAYRAAVDQLRAQRDAERDADAAAMARDVESWLSWHTWVQRSSGRPPS